MSLSIDPPLSGPEDAPEFDVSLPVGDTGGGMSHPVDEDKREWTLEARYGEHTGERYWVLQGEDEPKRVGEKITVVPKPASSVAPGVTEAMIAAASAELEPLLPAKERDPEYARRALEAALAVSLAPLARVDEREALARLLAASRPYLAVYGTAPSQAWVDAERVLGSPAPTEGRGRFVFDRLVGHAGRNGNDEGSVWCLDCEQPGRPLYASDLAESNVWCQCCGKSLPEAAPSEGPDDAQA